MPRSFLTKTALLTTLILNPILDYNPPQKSPKLEPSFLEQSVENSEFSIRANPIPLELHRTLHEMIYKALLEYLREYS
ncbi:hypothetical protein HOC13_04585 [Candidatus Woesearchaeota archaeon]|jgi:hypothetical protein|nr:hypothetical protein [Candidatus Woesearchaeota archaeon]